MWPARCVGCDLPHVLLCEACEAGLSLIDAAEACPYCAAPGGRILCTECDTAQAYGGFSFTAARVAGTFDGALARMVVMYKDGGERRLAEVMARLMAAAAGSDWRSWAQSVVFVPASGEAYRLRGFDHMELVAKHLCRRLRLPLLDVLYRGQVSDQRGLDRATRASNVSGSFSVLEGRERLILDRNILLIDDVFTTGSTLDAASKALLAAHAREIHVLAATRVW